MSEERIRVAVRVRKILPREKGSEVRWRALENNTITSVDGSKTYPFDSVYSPSVNNEAVFNDIGSVSIQSCMDGLNSTIFAYGQTSSGKTHTMLGTPDDPGLIHRAVYDLFRLVNLALNKQFLLRVSYMEIYNEQITDLLAEPDDRRPLKVLDDEKGNVYVDGVQEVTVLSPEEILDLLKSGEKNRHFGATNMNDKSSRSHTIFRIIIESSFVDDDEENEEEGDEALGEGRIINVSHLNLVDLAGSERASETGAVGDRLREGNNINKSLTVLGMVIRKLSEGAEFIPYRDSKLTRILKNSLGGNARTTIIATVSPTEQVQTKSTLEFASRAKTISQTAEVNEIVDDRAMMRRMRRQIEELDSELRQIRNGQGVQQKEELLNAELEKKRQEIDEREKIIAELSEQILNMKAQKVSVVQLPPIVIKDVSGVGGTGNKNPSRDRRQTWCGPRKLSRVSYGGQMSFPWLKNRLEDSILENDEEENTTTNVATRLTAACRDSSIISDVFLDAPSDAMPKPTKAAFITTRSTRKVQFSDRSPEVKQFCSDENDRNEKTGKQPKASSKFLNLDESQNGTPKNVLRQRLALKDDTIKKLSQDYEELEEFTRLENEAREETMAQEMEAEVKRLKRQVAQLTTEVSSLTEREAKALKKAEIAQGQIDEAVAEKYEAEQRCLKADTKVSIAMTEMNEIRDQLLLLQTALTERVDECERLRVENREMSVRLEASESMINNSTMASSGNMEQVALEAKVEEMEALLQKSNDEWSTKNQQLQHQLDQLTTEYRATLEAKDLEISKLAKDLDQLLEEQRQQTEDFHKLKSDNEDLVEQVSKLKEISSLERSADVLAVQNELKTKSSQVDELLEQRVQIRSNHESEISSLQQKLEEVDTELSEMKERFPNLVSSKTAAIMDLEKNLADKESQLADLQTLLSELRQAPTEEEVIQLQEERDEALRKVQQLTDSVVTLTKELEAVSTTNLMLSDLEASRESLQHTNIQLKAAIETQSQEIQDLNHKIRSLETKLATFNDLEKQLADALDIKSKQEIELSNVNHELVKAKYNCCQTKSALAAQVEIVQDLQHSIESLTIQLERSAKAEEELVVVKKQLAERVLNANDTDIKEETFSTLKEELTKAREQVAHVSEIESEFAAAKVQLEKLADLEEQLTEAKSCQSHAEDELRNLQEKLSSDQMVFHEKLSAVEAELAMAHEDISKLSLQSKEHEKTKIEMADLSDQLKLATSQLDQMTALEELQKSTHQRLLESQEEVQCLQELLNKTQADFDHLAEKLSSTEKELAMSKNFALVQEELVEVRRHMAELEEDYKNRLEKMAADEKELEGYLNQTQADYEHLAAKLSSTEAELTLAKNVQEELLMARDQLVMLEEDYKAKLEKMAAHEKELEEYLNITQNGYDQVAAKLSSAETQLSVANEQLAKVSELQSELAKTRDLLVAKEETCQDLEEQLASTNKELRETEEKLAASNSEIQALEEFIRKTQSDHNALTAKAISLEQTNQTLASDLAKVKESFQDAVTSRDEALGKLNQLMVTQTQLEEEYSDAKNCLEILQKQIGDSQQDPVTSGSSSDVIATLKRDLRAMDIQVKELKVAKVREVDKLTIQLKDIEADLRNERDLSRRLKEDLQKARSDLRRRINSDMLSASTRTSSQSSTNENVAPRSVEKSLTSREEEDLLKSSAEKCNWLGGSGMAKEMSLDLWRSHCQKAERKCAILEKKITYEEEKSSFYFDSAKKWKIQFVELKKSLCDRCAKAAEARSVEEKK